MNLNAKFALFREHWSPKIVGELNDSYVKLVKAKGDFDWHHHAKEDELFLVTKGQLAIKLRGRTINLKPGEFFIVPKGMEHKPVSQRESHILLIERKTTRNTGQIRNPRTLENLDRI